MTKENKSPVILLTGTPGVGKTSVSKKLATLMDAELIEVGSLVRKKRLFLRYNKRRKSYVVDEFALSKELNKMIKTLLGAGKACIVDTHLISVIQDEYTDFVIVLTCDPLILYNRILSKGAPIKKAVENVVSEFLNQLLVEVLERFDNRKVFVIDTSCKGVEEIASEILHKISSKRTSPIKRPLKRINWSFRTIWISKLLSSAHDRN